MIKRAVLTLAAIVALAAPALAQVNPQNMPPSSVYGRLPPLGGPGQAIPFSTFTGNLLTAISGDCTATFAGVITCTKTNGTLFGTVATANTGTSGHTIPYLDGNNIYSGDALFKDGRPWCDVRANGAVGDGLTDDTTAIQGCINIVQAFALGGTVYFPASNGSYCTFSGVTVSGSTSVRLIGASAKTVLDACHHDITTLTLNSSRSSVEYMQVWGKGVNNDTTTFGATHPAISLGTSCISCRISHVNVLGGTTPLALAAVDAVIEDIDASQGYGSAIAYVTAGQWLIRTKLDTGTPTTLPSPPFTVNAWAGTTPYTAGTVVSTQGYFIQCTTSGTSGNSAPTLKNLGINIPDGTAVWQLVSATTYYGLQIDTGASEVTVTQADMSGFFASGGVGITNTLSGIAPNHIKLSQTIIGNAYQAEIFAHDGVDLHLSEMEIGKCLGTGCVAIWFNTNWVGEAGIANSLIWGSPIGIGLNAGGHFNVEGNRIYGQGSQAIVVGTAGISNFNIIGNDFSNSVTYGNCNVGVAITAGASNNFTIMGNNFNGCGTAISNSSTASTDRIVDNPGYNPVGVTAAANVGASPATITAGPTPETHYINQSATNTATIAKGTRQIATLAGASTYYTVQLGPNESYTVTWTTTQPTYTKDVH
jgi:hypothetical protein